MSRRIYNADIDWFLNCAARALGMHSSFGGQIVCLESGGPSSGFTPPEWKGNLKEIERARRLQKVWTPTVERAKALLLAQYTGAMPSHSINKATKEPEMFRRYPTGIDGEIDSPGVALFLALENGEISKLVQACAKKDARGSRAIRDKYIELSREAQDFAHKDWSMNYRLRSAIASRIREQFE